MPFKSHRSVVLCPLLYPQIAHFRQPFCTSNARATSRQRLGVRQPWRFRVRARPSVSSGRSRLKAAFRFDACIGTMDRDHEPQTPVRPRTSVLECASPLALWIQTAPNATLLIWLRFCRAKAWERRASPTAYSAGSSLLNCWVDRLRDRAFAAGVVQRRPCAGRACRDDSSPHFRGTEATDRSRE